jgi:hypothetical protein
MMARWVDGIPHLEIQMQPLAYSTEDQIERYAERMMDRADRKYLAGDLTEEDYAAQIDEINAWVEQQMKGLNRA